MAEGRGYSGSQPASRVECGQWSPQQESPVPMSTYIVVDVSAVPSSGEDVVILMAGQEREIR